MADEISGEAQVGGHCIGVDPYYLTHKAEMTGYHPQVILAGRRINDGMAKFVAEQTVKQMIASGTQIRGARVIILGVTFKENCRDLRNSKVADIVSELQSFGIEVFVHDPLADPVEAKHEYGIDLIAWEELPCGDALIAAVSHREFAALSMAEISQKLNQGGVFVDIKATFDPDQLAEAGFRVWRL